MINLRQYIFEKFRISKNTSIYSAEDYYTITIPRHMKFPEEEDKYLIGEYSDRHDTYDIYLYSITELVELYKRNNEYGDYKAVLLPESLKDRIPDMKNKKFPITSGKDYWRVPGSRSKSGYIYDIVEKYYEKN